MKTIGIIGSRKRDQNSDFEKVKQALFKVYEDGDQLVSGGCPSGADHFAEQLAKIHQIPITIHYAKWNKHGKSAGFIRNGDIASGADILIACVNLIREGGTEDTIKKFCISQICDKVWTEAEKIEMGELILV